MKVVMVRSNSVNPDVRIEKEAKTLANAGYDVTILGWGRYGKKTVREESRSNYTIKRFQLRAPWGNRVIFYLPFWWVFEFTWLIRNKWDIVHAADFDTFIPALVAAKLKRKKIIYDIFDFSADSFPPQSILRSCIANLDISLMRFVDALIVVDPSRLKQIKGENNPSIVIIFNSPLEYQNLTDFELPSIEEHFKIFYAGILSQDRDFKSIIDITKNNKNICLEIAGWGQYEIKFTELSSQVSNIKFIGTVPYDEVIRRTMQSDLLFALYDPSVPNNRYASPNKLFEAMMCGKPILVSDKTAMADIVRDEKCGIVVPYGDVKVIKHALETLKDNPEYCKQLGANGRRAYENKYSWDIMGEKLLTIYHFLISERK
jgi:glycosyltransferase involved in cell wall biosynthesis